MAGIFKFFSALLAKIVGFATWFLSIFTQIFVDLWNIITDSVCWALDGALSIAASAIESVTVPFSPSTYYSMIPADTANVLGIIGVPQALSMIVGALIIRFTLQLIPFVRLGS